MTTTRYAILEDVLRQWDLNITESDLGNEVKSSDIVIERIRARLQSAESEFERVTDNAFRPVRVGVADSPATYEYHEGVGGGGSNNKPINVYLNHRHIVPFDSTEGDRFEIRTGRDTWKDITNQEGTQWRANYQKGVFEVMRGAYGGTISLMSNYGRNSNEDFFRVCYRYGGTGGDISSGGQTELDEELAQGDTGAVNVTDISRVPTGRNLYLVGNSEYIEATSDGSSLTVNLRGERNTEDQTHATGTAIHYCPPDLREAIAAKAAMELLRQDDTLDLLMEAGSSLEVNFRISELKEQWQQATARYNDNMGSK